LVYITAPLTKNPVPARHVTIQARQIHEGITIYPICQPFWNTFNGIPADREIIHREGQIRSHPSTVFINNGLSIDGDLSRINRSTFEFFSLKRSHSVRNTVERHAWSKGLRVGHLYLHPEGPIFQNFQIKWVALFIRTQDHRVVAIVEADIQHFFPNHLTIGHIIDQPKSDLRGLGDGSAVRVQQSPLVGVLVRHRARWRRERTQQYGQRGTHAVS